MNIQVGDALFEPLSGNIGEVSQILEHPDGKLVRIRWSVEGHLSHDTEHFYSKLVKSIKKGQIKYTPKSKAE